MPRVACNYVAAIKNNNGFFAITNIYANGDFAGTTVGSKIISDLASKLRKHTLFHDAQIDFEDYDRIKIKIPTTDIEDARIRANRLRGDIQTVAGAEYVAQFSKVERY